MWDRQIVVQERSSPDIVADIDGLKLDFLILLKQIKENTRLLSTIMSKSKTKMSLAPNSMIAKRGAKRYHPLFPKKDNAVKELEEKCLTSETPRFVIRTREWFSRGFFLTIIMQAEADNNQSGSRECGVQVNKSRGKYWQAKLSQKSVPTNSTETRNSFKPLQSNIELEVRGIGNQKANSGDNDQQTPSSSSSSPRRTRKSSKLVSIESVTNGHVFFINHSLTAGRRLS